MTTALILLPGLDGTGLLLQDFATSFGTKFPVHVLAYPVDQPMDYAALESWIRARLPQDQPFFLLGESFAGPLALSIAATPPAGLQGVILCCSFARNPRPLLGWLRALLPLLPVSALPLPLLSHFTLGRHATVELQQTLKESLRQVAPAVLHTRGQAVLAVDKSALLAQIKLPVLYLTADEDRLVPGSCGDWLAAQITDCQIVRLPAPHFLLQVLPQQAATVIGDFMQSNS